MDEAEAGIRGGGLHIAVAGPMTLDMLETRLADVVPTAGFPFPATSQLVLSYLEAGHTVTAVTTATDISAPVRREGGGLRLVVLPARGRGRARAFDFFHRERVAIRSELDRARPDVIHAHWTYEFGLAARAAGAPALVTVHDWAPAVARFNRHPYWYFRWAMQIACLLRPGPLSAPSEYVASRVRRAYRRSCEVVHNGVDLAPFAAAASDSQRVCEAAVVVMLNVGFSPRKNVAAALRAWPAVRSQHPDAVLELAGPEYEPGGLAERWAAEQGLTDGVRFIGPLSPDAVPALLAGADVFLHTSREESFGIVLVEAMAAGLPVIAGRDSGAPAAVLGDAGLLVDVDDSDDVARAVSELLSDADRAARLRAAGARRAQQYELSTTVDRYLDLLRAAASSGSAARASTTRPTA